MPSSDAADWIRNFRPAPDAPVQLACFPHAGGSASFFFPVATALAPGIDVFAVQYPGRQDRRTEKCVDDLNELADRAFQALRSRLDRPMALFGHSLGATLAFEVARRIERHTGGQPVRLLVSGRRAPSRQVNENLRLVSDDRLVAEMRALSGTDDRILGDEEMLRMALPPLRADYTAIETYVCPPDAVLKCPITALAGDQDARAPEEDVRAWSQHTAADCDVRLFPGGHFYLVAEQRGVIGAIKQALESDTRGSGDRQGVPL